MEREPKIYQTNRMPVKEIKMDYIETLRFFDEDRNSLKKKGYLIYSLTGQSIKTLREKGRQFNSRDWHNQYPDFEAMPSKISELAINPKQLFLPDSDGKTPEFPN